MATLRPTSKALPGYTLVEVLVAVSITTVLAALGVSGLQSASQSAVTARTLSQLREIGAASQAWSNEHSAFFPPSWDNTEGQNRSYAQVLDPYLHGVEEFRSKDSKFIGYNKRLKVKVNAYSHPITFSLNRSVSRDITDYGTMQEQLVSLHSVTNPTEVILAVDGCQNPRNLNQANASTYEVFHAVRDTGTAAEGHDPIPIGPDSDTPQADGWIRYAGGGAHALMCDGSVRRFSKGSIQKRNIWRKFRE